jgi:CubicO group peptidase (beta-lactamase class C family)
MRPNLIAAGLLAVAPIIPAAAATAVELLPSPIISNPSLARTRVYWPTRDWRMARPSEAGMDPSVLDGLTRKLAANEVLAALIVRRGCIVYERYKAGSGTDTLFNIYSCSKSVTSALVGIAIDRGLLKGVDRPVSEFFPAIAKTVDAARKSGLTLGHLLAMNSGLDWPEWGIWNYFFQPMIESPDWVDFVLARPMAVDPGSVFSYNTGGSQVLSAIVGRVTGMPAAEFARHELFDRIGISRVEWGADPNGVSTGGYGIRMSARDAARFAYLYLNNGEWDGRQVVSRAWVGESTRQHSEGHAWFGRYGLHWWLKPLADARAASTFFAMGYGGQYLFVVPSLDLVAVFFSWMPGGSNFLPMQWLEEFVIRAVK